MANQTGTLYSYNVDQTGKTVPSAVGASADLRRIHNFGDRVAELAPDESPFFVYLNKVAKVATNDPVFRFLENRSKIDWTSRNFNVKSTALADVAADSTYTISSFVNSDKYFNGGVEKSVFEHEDGHIVTAIDNDRFIIINNNFNFSSIITVYSSRSV